MTTLTRGLTYQVELAVNNTTTKKTSQPGALPWWPAVLTVGIEANAGGKVLIPEQEEAHDFTGGETRIFPYYMPVPMDAVGTGSIQAWVKAPNGNVLAQATMAIEVPSVPPGYYDLSGGISSNYHDSGAKKTFGVDFFNPHGIAGIPIEIAAFAADGQRNLVHWEERNYKIEGPGSTSWKGTLPFKEIGVYLTLWNFDPNTFPALGVWLGTGTDRKRVV